MEEAKILVVDDEQAIGDMVEIILRKEGFTLIDVCASCKEAELQLMKKGYDLYILDIMLPDGTGLELATKIRKRSTAPIFFLTAKAADADILRGFMHGADDYITKPFNPMELAARVKVQTARYMASLHDKHKIYEVGEFRLDVEGAALTVRGQAVTLTQKQFQLLELFCHHPNQVLSKEQLYEQVWGFDGFVDDNTIMVHIRKLREKLEVDPSRPEYIVTVRGIGYKLQV
ncbi:transcriptional regulatory protein YvrH [Sporosarcina sp. NCCP-2222]|uniref:response regulator transcription factor n=1 Tax=Sporosarcina sp. NCCP-2222 TaxID=2935073 RepID=UPI002086B49D|nr:response regulator transcription factor [Sporosarcina sp. NCCP-2222]GKV55255.1 transcriptional regulatory protein YvrH [Sporosarcina sp. NCCP-2222]